MSTSGSNDRRRCVLQLVPAMHNGGARDLVRHGYRSVVVSAGGRLTDRLVATGVEHITLPLGQKNPLAAWRHYLALKKLITRLQPDIVHAGFCHHCPRPVFGQTVQQHYGAWGSGDCGVSHGGRLRQAALPAVAEK